jgi:hypothetical protein
LLLGGAATPGLAGELTLFGPQRCERTTGKKNVYRFNFTSDTEQKGHILGTLLIWNGSPDWKHQVASAVIRVNGKKVVGPDRFGTNVDVLQVPLENLKPNNRIDVEVNGKPGSYLTLQVSEIGSQGPLFSGPQQYPFVCRTEQSALGQPLVDNYKNSGIPVYKEGSLGKTDEIAGYCKDCSVVTRVDYYYRSTDRSFKALEKFADYPADLDYTITNEGLSVPYIVRLERGTINRFIYAIAVLHPWNDRKQALNAWNGKLFFRFD